MSPYDGTKPQWVKYIEAKWHKYGSVNRVSNGSGDSLATFCKLDPLSEQISVKFEVKFEYIYT